MFLRPISACVGGAVLALAILPPTYARADSAMSGATNPGAASTIAQNAPPSPNATISVAVRDAGGKPIPGVNLRLTGSATATATTTEAGTSTFGNLAGGTYLVTASKTGFANIDVTITVEAGGTQTATFTLEPVSQTTLRQIGRVVTSRANGATQLNTTPAAVSTISQQTYVDRGQDQVANLLEELPGVELQRFSSGGGPGANTVAALRGADSSETQTLIDGHPVSGGPQGNYLIQFLNPLLLSDIEVSKGPGAFGNEIDNQVNGTINYRTPSITKSFTATGTLGYDTYNGSTDSLVASDTIGKFGFLVGYAQFGTPGYNTSPVLSVVSDGSSIGPGHIPTATATTSIPATQSFENHSDLFKLGYTFSNSTAVTLGFLDLNTYVDYTGNLTTEEPFTIIAGPCAVCGTNNFYSGLPTYTAPSLGGLVGKTVFASSTQDNLYLGNYEYDNEPFFTGDLRTTFGPGSFLARYYAASISRDISDPEEAFQPVQCDDPTCNFSVIANNGDLSGAFFQTQSDYLHGADFEYQIPVAANTYTVAYDSHGDRTTSCSGGEANPSGCSVPSVLQTSNTFSARGNFRVGSRLGIDFANYFSHTTFVGARYDPRLGITFQPNANAVIRIAAGSSFVAPSAEIAYDVIPHVNRKTFYEGASFAPETSTSLDLGSDIRTGSDSKLVIDGYATRLFNRFTSISTQVSGTYGGSPYTSLQVTGNQASALEKGIELTFVKAPRYGFGTTEYLNFLRAYAGGSDTATMTAAGVPIQINAAGSTIYGTEADGQQFAGYPFTHGRAEVNYTTRNGVRAAFGTSYYGSLNSFNEPGFALFDANVGAPLRAGLTFRASVENIFNHDDYRTFGEYNYGVSLPALGGGTSGNTLYFAPPREFTVSIERSIGKPAP